MTAFWAIVGGFAGLIRMGLAGALVALVGFAYVTVWLIPAAETKARQGYVLEVRALSAEALAARLLGERDANQTVVDAYQVQYQNALAQQAAKDAELERTIADNEALRRGEGRACPLSQSDLDFLRK